MKVLPSRGFFQKQEFTTIILINFYNLLSPLAGLGLYIGSPLRDIRFYADFFPPYPKLFNVLGSQNSFKEMLAPGGMLQAPRNAGCTRVKQRSRAWLRTGFTPGFLVGFLNREAHPSPEKSQLVLRSGEFCRAACPL